MFIPFYPPARCPQWVPPSWRSKMLPRFQKSWGGCARMWRVYVRMTLHQGGGWLVFPWRPKLRPSAAGVGWRADATPKFGDSAAILSQRWLQGPWGHWWTQLGSWDAMGDFQMFWNSRLKENLICCWNKVNTCENRVSFFVYPRLAMLGAGMSGK